MDNKEFKQIWGFYRANSKIESCFAENIGGCSSKISSAHSLQKVGILNQIEASRAEGKRIYSLEEWVFDNDQIVNLKLVGKKAASIFSGFCDKHDVELFAPIETKPFSFNDRQLFLYYYRGFAHSHHNVAEQYNYMHYCINNHFVETAEEPIKTQQHNLFQEYQEFEQLYRLGHRVRSRLNFMLGSNDFSTMKHYYRVIPYKKIASSQRLVPSFTYSNQSLKRWESISQIILSVIPDNDRTIILFSFFNDDLKGIQFIDELKELNFEKFTHAVSSILMYSGMNTFFCPDWWDDLAEYQKKIFVSELNYLSEHAHNHVGFYHTNINWFL